MFETRAVEAALAGAVDRLRLLPIPGLAGPLTVEDQDFLAWAGSARTLGDLDVNGAMFGSLCSLVVDFSFRRPAVGVAIVAGIALRLVRGGSGAEWPYHWNLVSGIGAYAEIILRDAALAEALVLCLCYLQFQAEEWPDVAEDNRDALHRLTVPRPDEHE